MPLIGSMMQPKLAVSRDDDASEYEANNVADSVVQREVATVDQEEREEEKEQGAVQRKCTECAEEDEHLQREPATGQGETTSEPSSFGQNLGGGEPLPTSSLAFFGSRMGYDFSGVRIHANSEAASSARSIGARAYTVGHDIAFGPGEFSPGTRQGDRLLAHELTHVVQQRGQVMRRVQRQTIHVESGRFVGQIGGAENNRRGDVLAVIGRLNELGAYTSPTDYQTERSAVAALPARSHVLSSLIPQTIATITQNDNPTLDTTAAQQMGLALSDSVGRGMANNKADILLLQDLLREHFHLRPAAHRSERAAVNSHPDPNIPDSLIPTTITAITGLRRSYVAGTHTARFRRQLIVSARTRGHLHQHMQWVPSPSPPSLAFSSFRDWATAGTRATPPAWNTTTTINCWEMLLLSAYNARYLSWRWIHETYTGGPSGSAWFAYLERRLAPRGTIPFHQGNPNTPRPHRGQIVFWNAAVGDHMALAEGARNGSGRELVISFWPPPLTPFTPGGTIDEVKQTTIEDLSNWMIGHGMGTPAVTFGDPPW